MAKSQVTLRQQAEGAFSECVSVLFHGPGKSEYLKDEGQLTRDARCLAMFLLSRHHLPGCACPAMPDWKRIGEEADRLDRDGIARVADHFPRLEDDPDPEALVDAATLSDMGFFYERLKDFEVTLAEEKPEVRSSRFTRKRRGTFFTPLSVCRFMVHRVLKPCIENDGLSPMGALSLRVLDPAMGTGQFLLAAADLLVKALRTKEEEDLLALRRKVFEHCLFGIDLDPENVDMTRFLLGLYTGRPDPDLPGIRQGDAVIETNEETQVFGEDGFPEKLFRDREEDFIGFDAIVGNPPYVAVKNEVIPAKYKPYHGGSSQIDYYLLFIHKYALKRFLKEGGGISFIVPDPLLLRANAEAARQRLLEDLDLEFLLHIKGVFPRTSVANVIFLARRSEGEPGTDVQVARVDNPRRVRSFRKKGDPFLKEITREIPGEYFRGFPRKEFRYLYTQGAGTVMKHLDTERPLHAGPGIVVRPLHALARAKGAIFRGEEVGKDRIRGWTSRRAEGGYPVLLGGENLSRYAIRDDGLFIEKKRVRKDRARYMRHKILLQKSTDRIVAALDERGYVTPQSVYGILIDDDRVGYPFLLAQLNSRLLTYFMQVMFTGYKLVQPQIEIEDLKMLPVMVPEFKEPMEVRSSSLDTAKSLFAQYIRTDDPGWILEYLDDNIKLGSRLGSAMIHDLLDFLGSQMIIASTDPMKSMLPRQRMEWLVDLVVYKIFGLGLEEIETVENFFGDTGGEAGAESAAPETGEGPREDAAEAARTGRLVFGESTPDEGEAFLEKEQE